MSQKKTILIVCTGNICRSPMAEGLMKKHLDPEKFTILSAGTGGLEGYPASDYGMEVCGANGIDISGHRSTALNGELVDKSDIILVMAAEHLHLIQRYFPSSVQKLYLLKKYPLQSDSFTFEDDVPDPIGSDREEYERIYEEIERAVRRIIPVIRKQLSSEEDSHN